MKRNDATRERIASADRRRLRAVVARQGQALLDADFDQQSRHELERLEIETLNSLGSPGRFVYPAGDNGFKITTGGLPAILDIGAGHGYLDGWLLENVASCKLTNQPHPRFNDTFPTPTIITIKSLVRLVDPVEDTVLADAALGDAQASGRSRVDWQVFPFGLTGGGALTCATVLSNPQWQKLIAPSTGQLAVTVQSSAPPTDPCSLTPGGGYSGLENLLYRVEVDGGANDPTFPTIDGPRFVLNNLKLKYSRRNASVLARVTGVSGVEITVSPPSVDPRSWFAPGLWAEIVHIDDDLDPRGALANPRMFRVAGATDDKVTLEATVPQLTAVGVTSNDRWFLRLWEPFPGGTGPGLATVVAPTTISNPIDLGNGLSITLTQGSFRRGDYWTFSVRADGTVDWPKTGAIPDMMRPHGPEVRYAPLAVYNGAAFEDCRIPFATLTDRALLYRGGDGQSVFCPPGVPMVDLPAKLRVAVMRGETPVVGAPVRWSYVGPAAGSCLINGAVVNAATPSAPVLTDVNGLAEVSWAIDASQVLALHRVQAAIVTGPTSTSVPPVVFAAHFRTAQQTGYTPGNCKHLTVDNVQEALDTLCGMVEDNRSLSLKSIVLPGASPTLDLINKELILNGYETPADSLLQGIVFNFDMGLPDLKPLPWDPVVEVEIDLPYPTTDYDKLYWADASGIPQPGNKVRTITGPFGFQRMRLDGTVEVADKKPGPGLVWTPSPQAKEFLFLHSEHMFGQAQSPRARDLLKLAGWIGQPTFERVLCRIRLRSSMIWVDDKAAGRRFYLNAEHLGTIDKVTRRELLLKDRDPQRAADLDIFIYLTIARPPTPGVRTEVGGVTVAAGGLNVNTGLNVSPAGPQTVLNILRSPPG